MTKLRREGGGGENQERLGAGRGGESGGVARRVTVARKLPERTFRHRPSGTVGPVG